MSKSLKCLIVLVASVVLALSFPTAFALPNSSTDTDVGPYRFPSAKPGNYRPVNMKYCCFTYLDTNNTVFVTNKRVGFLYDLWLGSSGYMDGMTYKQQIPWAWHPTHGFSSLQNLTDRQSGSGDNNSKGQFLTCPAGFVQTAESYYQPNSGNDYDHIICTPIRQECRWIGANGFNNFPTNTQFRFIKRGSDRRIGNTSNMDDVYYNMNQRPYNYCQ